MRASLDYWHQQTAVRVDVDNKGAPKDRTVTIARRQDHFSVPEDRFVRHEQIKMDQKMPMHHRSSICQLTDLPVNIAPRPCDLPLQVALQWTNVISELLPIDIGEDVTVHSDPLQPPFPVGVQAVAILPTGTGDGSRFRAPSTVCVSNDLAHVLAHASPRRLDLAVLRLFSRRPSTSDISKSLSTCILDTTCGTKDCHLELSSAGVVSRLPA